MGRRAIIGTVLALVGLAALGTIAYLAWEVHRLRTEQAAGAEPRRGTYAEALEAFRAGRYDESISILDSIDEPDAGIDNLRGWSMLSAGQTAEAIQAFERSIELDPQAWDSWCGLGFAYLERGNPRRAIRHFEVGVRNSEPALPCRKQYAETLVSLDDSSGAADAYWDVLKIQPDDRDIASKLAQIARQTRLGTPPEFDFLAIAGTEMGSLENFLMQRGLHPDDRDTPPYGRAIARLAMAAIIGSRDMAARAEQFFREAAEAATDPRVMAAAEYGADYARNLAGEGVGATALTGSGPQRVEIEYLDPPPAFRRIILGTSRIRISDGATVKVQVDRVMRDWLSAHNFTTPPWQLDADGLTTWHEGAKIRELLQFADVSVIPVWGTAVRRFGDTWYAPDAEGLFRFPVTEDKVYGYPTNILVDDRNVIINDTHGISAVAWDSTDADLVIGCGDHPGKVEAAYWLANHGVNVYTPTDRFLGQLIGARTDGTIIGSAPVRSDDGGALIGDQPLAMDADETVVVSTTDQGYPLQYYDAPMRYFAGLEAYTGREFDIVPVDIPAEGRADLVVEEARRINARLIGLRVRTEAESEAVAAWLDEDDRNRAILFHTAAYPDGYRLFFDYPAQTSFGDVRPRFE